MKKQDYVSNCEAIFSSAIEARTSALNVATSNVESLSSDDTSDNVKALKDAHKSAKARLTECETLSKFVHSDTAMTICFQHKIDFASMLSDKNANTRELKKRFIHTLQAIILNSAEMLKNDDFKFYSAVFSNRLKSDNLSLDQVKSAMSHETTTQARYLKDFLCFFDAAKFVDKSLTLNLESAFLKKVKALFE